MKKKQILIVEDERIVADDIKVILQEPGYAVSGIALSGEEALKRAEEVHPDLVLMDIVLEGEMAGISSIQMIKNFLRKRKRQIKKGTGYFFCPNCPRVKAVLFLAEKVACPLFFNCRFFLSTKKFCQRTRVRNKSIIIIDFFEILT